MLPRPARPLTHGRYLARPRDQRRAATAELARQRSRRRARRVFR